MTNVLSQLFPDFHDRHNINTRLVQGTCSVSNEIFILMQYLLSRKELSPCHKICFSNSAISLQFNDISN